MSIINDRLEDILTTLSSNTKSTKSSAYLTLLRFQEQSSEAPQSVEALAQKSSVIVASIAGDIFVEDEEIAVQALKCLGFMIYHPSTVAALSVDDVKLVLHSLTKVIAETRMKTVCNLGVWCVSMQQFQASLVSVHLMPLLQAVVHALENPFGSLSVTFEAIQAVMKLVEQLSGKMMEFSHVWAPSVYRRLISTEKKERDISQRCLMKIRSIILPPPASLSKQVAQDIKQKLLYQMKDLLKKGMKIPILQAWGWFIRLLGSQAMKRRQLVNDLLKIPEQTFSDHNPQVQIASQVAWEGLIDALIDYEKLDCFKEATQENGNQQCATRTGICVDIQSNGFSKSIKLIMTPLVGVLSSENDVSVRSSCLKTWFYLLYKLDISINSLAVLELVLHPVFEIVFQNGPDSKNIWLWNSCLDLLEDFISAKCRETNSYMYGLENMRLSSRWSLPGDSVSGAHSWKEYAIKWMGWDLSHLDFCFRIMKVIIDHVSAAAAPESRSIASGSVIRIFGSVLRAVQTKLKDPSINYESIMSCLCTILSFISKICECTSSEDGGSYDLFQTCLKFIEAAVRELEPSLLGSPLYKVALDIKYIGALQSTSEGETSSQSSLAYMDMVSPVVYLNVLYFCAVIQMHSSTPKKELSVCELQKFFSFLLSSYDPMENLQVSLHVLYKHISYTYIEIWLVIAEGLTHYIDHVREPNLSNLHIGGPVCKAICYLLLYPFSLYSCLWKLEAGGAVKEYIMSLEHKILEHAIEIWKSVYMSVTSEIFDHLSVCNLVQSFCALSNVLLDENDMTNDLGHELDLSNENLKWIFSTLYGEALICILQQMEIAITAVTISDQTQTFTGIRDVAKFVSRFLELSYTRLGKEPDHSSLISRVLSALANLVTHLHSKRIILQFFEILTCPLIQLLSLVEEQSKNVNEQLGLLWREWLRCIQKSHPPIVFDSTALRLQADLLEKALTHTSSSISNPTIAYWKSTFGKQINLEFPENLLPVLDRLSRNGTLHMGNRSMGFLQKWGDDGDGDGDGDDDDDNGVRRCKVTTMRNLSSKKVQFVVEEFKQQAPPCLKRKRLELTEHQKEVRRAQQGRERDCSGHGPGVRTYTTVDFSQGNEESQDSQDYFRDSERL